MFNNWGFESLRQFWTLFPHTPDNSFLGFVVEPPSIINGSVKRNQAVLYGKEGWYSQGKEGYIDTIGEAMQVHSTFKVHLCSLVSDSHSTILHSQYPIPSLLHVFRISINLSLAMLLTMASYQPLNYKGKKHDSHSMCILSIGPGTVQSSPYS